MSTIHPTWAAEVTDGSIATDCLIAGDSEEDEKEDEEEEDDQDDEDEGDNKNEDENDGYSE